MKTFMLFTDGGAFSKPNKKFDAGSAFRVLKRHKNIEKSELYEQFVDLTPDRTMAYAEIHAIEKGLEHLVSHISGLPMEEWDKYNIQVFTDSENCYKTLTAWMYAWLKVARKNNTTVLKSSTGKDVKNQTEIVNAFRYKTQLEKMGVNVRFFHINSHITGPKVNAAHERFNKRNNVNVDKKEFLYYALQNSLCDKALNDKMQEIRESGVSLDELAKGN